MRILVLFALVITIYSGHTKDLLSVKQIEACSDYSENKDRNYDKAKKIERDFDEAKGSINRNKTILDLESTNLNNARRQANNCYDSNCRYRWQELEHRSVSNYNQAVERYNYSVQKRKSLAKKYKTAKRRFERAKSQYERSCEGKSFKSSDLKKACRGKSSEFCRQNIRNL